jgi:hypothetical protein
MIGCVPAFRPDRMPSPSGNHEFVRVSFENVKLYQWNNGKPFETDHDGTERSVHGLATSSFSGNNGKQRAC